MFNRTLSSEPWATLDVCFSSKVLWSPGKTHTVQMIILPMIMDPLLDSALPSVYGLLQGYVVMQLCFIRRVGFMSTWWKQSVSNWCLQRSGSNFLIQINHVCPHTAILMYKDMTSYGFLNVICFRQSPSERWKPVTVLFDRLYFLFLQFLRKYCCHF